MSGGYSHDEHYAHILKQPTIWKEMSVKVRMGKKKRSKIVTLFTFKGMLLELFFKISFP